MVASFRSQSATSQTLGGDPVVNVPAGVVDGDLLIAYGICAAGGTITATGAWTTHPNSFGGQGPLFYRVASSEPASYTFTVSGTANSVVSIVAIRNPRAGANPIDVAANVAGASGNIALPSVNAVNSNSLLVQLVAKLGSTSFTPPGTASERFDAAVAPANYTVAGGDEIVNAGATGTRTWVPAAGTQGSIGYILAVAPIPPGAGTFTGSYAFNGTGFTGAEGPAEGSFSGGYDFSGAGFTGEAPGVASGSFVGSYDFSGSGFTGAGGDPDTLVNVYATEGGRKRFGGRK